VWYIQSDLNLSERSVCKVLTTQEN
jgi:hypothetical protein